MKIQNVKSKRKMKMNRVGGGRKDNVFAMLGRHTWYGLGPRNLVASIVAEKMEQFAGQRRKFVNMEDEKKKKWNKR
jgi:hypothetical protein